MIDFLTGINAVDIDTGLSLSTNIEEQTDEIGNERTPIEVDVVNTDTNNSIAIKTKNLIDAESGLTAIITGIPNVIEVRNDVFGEVPDAWDYSANFDVQIISQGGAGYIQDRTSIKVEVSQADTAEQIAQKTKIVMSTYDGWYPALDGTLIRINPIPNNYLSFDGSQEDSYQYYVCDAYGTCEAGYSWNSEPNNARPNLDISTKVFGTHSGRFRGGSARFETVEHISTWAPLGQKWTTSFWFYMDNPLAASYYTFFAGTTDHEVGLLYLHTIDKIGMYASSTGTSWDIMTGTDPTQTTAKNTWNAYQWYFCVYEFTGTSYNLYIDGNLEISYASTVSVREAIGGIRIGLWGSGAYPLIGGIDEFKITFGYNEFGGAHERPKHAYDPLGSALDAEDQTAGFYIDVINQGVTSAIDPVVSGKRGIEISYAYNNSPGLIATHMAEAFRKERYLADSMPDTEKRYEDYGAVIVNPDGDDGVSSLLHFNGDDGNTKMVDEYDVDWGLVNQTHIQTDYSKFGNTSLVHDGTDDYTYTSKWINNTNFGNKFTLEMWWYTANNTQNSQGMSGGCRGDHGFLNGLNTDNIIHHYYASVGTSWNIASNHYSGAVGPVNNYEWHHVALVQDGVGFSHYWDGKRVWHLNSASILYIENGFQLTGYNNTSWDHNGGVDEFKLTIGKAVYLEDFTPPTYPYAESYARGGHLEATAGTVSAISLKTERRGTSGSVQILTDEAEISEDTTEYNTIVRYDDEIFINTYLNDNTKTNMRIGRYAGGPNIDWLSEEVELDKGLYLQSELVADDVIVTGYRNDTGVGTVTTNQLDIEKLPLTKKLSRAGFSWLTPELTYNDRATTTEFNSTAALISDGITVSFYKDNTADDVYITVLEYENGVLTHSEEELVFEGRVTSQSVAKISENRFVLVWDDYGYDTIFAKVGEYIAGKINWLTETKLIFSTGVYDGWTTVCGLEEENVFMVSYRATASCATSAFEYRDREIYLNDTISATVAVAPTHQNQNCHLKNNLFFHSYSITSNGYNMDMFEYNSTTRKLRKIVYHQISSTTNAHSGVALLSNNVIVFAYQHNSLGWAKAIQYDEELETLTDLTSEISFTYDALSSISAIELSNNRFSIAYKETNISGAGTLKIGKYNDGKIHWLTKKIFFRADSSGIDNCSLTALDKDTVLLTYAELYTPRNAIARVFSVPDFDGFTKHATDKGESLIKTKQGISSGFTNLIPGENYYFDYETGEIMEQQRGGQKKVGRAISETEIILE